MHSEIMPQKSGTPRLSPARDRRKYRSNHERARTTANNSG
jgi:hypothetical protein